MTARLGRMAAVACLAALAASLLALAGCRERSASPAAEPDSILFCFWNVENLFDDRDDHRTSAGDREYDGWLARDAAARQLKLERLSEAILAMNDGRGPDILAVAEVEGIRAAELLRQALNARIAEPERHYGAVLMKEVSSGRHIAPAILTRFPVAGERTRLLGSRQRILEGHIQVNGQELVVVAAHWTSRLTDKTGKRRCDYADKIYGQFKAMALSNPAVDLIVCGDFNDPPEAKSVTRHLHATGDAEAVRQPAPEPRLFNLFAHKDREEFGTCYYSGKWSIFDQIIVSPGLLDDRGWSCAPDSAQRIDLFQPQDRRHRPWRFGGAHARGSRGYSDHFPVTVRLKVHAP